MAITLSAANEVQWYFVWDGTNDTDTLTYLNSIPGCTATIDGTPKQLSIQFEYSGVIAGVGDTILVSLAPDGTPLSAGSMPSAQWRSSFSPAPGWPA